MARKPSDKPRTKKVSKAVESIVTALRFVEPASKDIGTINQTHCMISGGWVAAFDGLLMMAAKIDTDITAYPNTKRLLATLSRCDEAVQITQLDNNRLGVKSGKFSATIPCLEPGLLTFTPPDPTQGAFNEAVVAALKTVGMIAKENAPRMVQASVMLRANSAVATDGVTAFEAWHGLPMPTVVLPKVFITELLKITKKPVSAGASPNTFTVYFDDESFIRTQLYVEPYPDVDKVLNVNASPYPIPAELWPALAKLDAMKGDAHNVYFKATKLQTDNDETVGASYEFNDEAWDVENVCFNIDFLRRFETLAQTVDWDVDERPGMAAFYGPNFRGVLMQKGTTKPAPITPEAIEHAVAQLPGAMPAPGSMVDDAHYGDDDEIPF